MNTVLSKVRVTWTQALRYVAVGLISQGGSLNDYAGQGMIHNLGRTEQDGIRFHRATQNITQFKTWIVYFLNFSIWYFRTMGN